MVCGIDIVQISRMEELVQHHERSLHRFLLIAKLRIVNNGNIISMPPLQEYLLLRRRCLKH